MSQLSDLAAHIMADKRQADELSSYLLASRDLANELQTALSQTGVDNKASQLGRIATQLGEVQNSRWLATGHLDDALMVLNSAMTGAYASTGRSAEGGSISTTKTNADGGQSLLGWFQGADVSIRVADSYEPLSGSDSLGSTLGPPRDAPEEPDTTGDESTNKFRSFTRKLVRNAPDIHAQVKDTAGARVDTATAYEPPQYELREVVGPSGRQDDPVFTQGAGTHLDAAGIARLR